MSLNLRKHTQPSLWSNGNKDFRRNFRRKKQQMKVRAGLKRHDKRKSEMKSRVPYHPPQTTTPIESRDPKSLPGLKDTVRISIHYHFPHMNCPLIKTARCLLGPMFHSIAYTNSIQTSNGDDPSTPWTPSLASVLQQRSWLRCWREVCSTHASPLVGWVIVAAFVKHGSVEVERPRQQARVGLSIWRDFPSLRTWLLLWSDDESWYLERELCRTHTQISSREDSQKKMSCSRVRGLGPANKLPLSKQAFPLLAKKPGNAIHQIHGTGDDQTSPCSRKYKYILLGNWDEDHTKPTPTHHCGRFIKTMISREAEHHIFPSIKKTTIHLFHLFFFYPSREREGTLTLRKRFKVSLLQSLVSMQNYAALSVLSLSATLYTSLPRVTYWDVWVRTSRLAFGFWWTSGKVTWTPYFHWPGGWLGRMSKVELKFEDNL